MLRGGPDPVLIAWLLFIVGGAAILYQPRYGVYLILFEALVGDEILSPWYPFVKNFSSAESIFYLHKSLIFSPLEVYLVLTFLSWLGRRALQREYRFYPGPLFWPMMVFTAFLFSGLVYGLSKGGNLNIALWEIRPIVYMPMMLVLVSNLITTRQHVNNLMWIVMIALLLEGINGDLYYFFVLKTDLSQVEAITEHSAAIHMNTFFLFILAAWLYKASLAKRFFLPLMLPFIGLTYLATQRRAAFLTLIIALVLIALILFKENRRAFWLIVPPLIFAFAIYTAAFWNSGGALGEPVRAIKSVVDQNQASLRDQQSNIYRFMENVNASFTIHTAPITGVGFGNKFLIIVPMADISNFIWWEYITHNSIVWIWMVTGVGGFLAMIFLVGYAIMTGVRVLWKMPGGDLSAIALVAVLYLIMHFTYAYVDMSWDIQSMLYVGAMMGLINILEHIVVLPEKLTVQIERFLPHARP